MGKLSRQTCCKENNSKNLKGEVIAVYESAQEAYLATGVCPRNIRQVASKEPYNKKGSIRKQAGGFIWEDAEK
jgi:hypothetical protein